LQSIVGLVVDRILLAQVPKHRDHGNVVSCVIREKEAPMGEAGLHIAVGGLAGVADQTLRHMVSLCRTREMP
jgi:hypothetical protein